MGKYLLVDSSDISMNYISKNSPNDKGYDNNTSLRLLFNMHKIPHEYQKIAVHLCIHNIFVNADAKEVIYGYPFDVTGRPIIEKDNKKILQV